MEHVFAMTWERTAAAASTAPPGRVWALLLDGRRWSDWCRGLQWMVVEGPPCAGSVLTMKPKGAPQTAFRIEALMPERLLSLELTIGPVARLRLRWELEPAAAGTSIAGAVEISGPLAGLLLRRTAHRIADLLPGNLERLAERAAAE